MNEGAAFVVGGSGGLGSAVCSRLAQEWPGLVVGYRSSEQAALEVIRSLPSSCTAIPLPCDLRDAASVERSMTEAALRFGRIGTVILASGVPIGQPYVSRIDEAGWREVLEVEVLGFTRLIAASLPIFRRQKGGNYVALTSVAIESYPPGDALSAVPKAAVEMLCRAVAKEEGRFGIRANAVAPGIIDSGLGASFLRTLYTPEIWETQRQRIALKRFGAGEDIAEAVAFLSSNRARYITGQTLTVDGGFSL
ncbi:MAG: SDR family NAD(P)-dependent oxidoreductase [Janthinobacterium lividum]